MVWFGRLFVVKPPAFVIPTNIAVQDRVRFLLSVIDRYREELVPLRRMFVAAKKKIERLEEEVAQYKRDFNRLVKRIKQFEKDADKLKKEKEELEKEIGRLTKTNKRLTTALFEHGNLKSNVGSKGRGKKKTKGGQKGHADTNRESREEKRGDTSQYSKQRLYLEECPKCGKEVNRVNSTKSKVLIDIVVNPQVVKFLLELERQWCGDCCKQVSATHRQSLPFTEYGINTLMVILLLRFKGNLSLSKIGLVLEIAFGLPMATSSIQSLLNQANRYLGDHYQELVRQVRDGQLMYNDETGWLIGKQRAWVWIMANKDTTVYYAAESRGHGIFQQMYGHSQATTMHDGLASYEAGLKNKDKHAYCWAHFLRYVHEETDPDPPRGIGRRMRRKIINLYRLKDKSITKQKLQQQLESGFNQILNHKTRTDSVKNIQARLATQKQGLIKALTDTPDGTNNLAERELRPMVLLRKTTNGSNTFNGMEITTTLNSVIQTLSKQPKSFFPTLQHHIQTGVSKKHPSFDYS